MKGPDKETWFRSLEHEFGRLYQGVGTRIEGTKILTFIPKRKVPFTTKEVTYGLIVCDIRPNKSETHRSRLTVCRNFLDFEGVLSTPTSKVTTTKLMVNNIISTKNGKCLCLDIKMFYLKNPLPGPEYMKMHISMIPQEIIDQYNFENFKYDKDWCYMKIDKGMNG